MGLSLGAIWRLLFSALTKSNEPPSKGIGGKHCLCIMHEGQGQPDKTASSVKSVGLPGNSELFLPLQPGVFQGSKKAILQQSGIQETTLHGFCRGTATQCSTLNRTQTLLWVLTSIAPHATIYRYPAPVTRQAARLMCPHWALVGPEYQHSIEHRAGRIPTDL